MSVVARLDAFQRRRPVVGFPIAVLYKFFDDFGVYLAALLTYYAFISLFPLLLLLATVLGYVLAGDPDLQQRVLNSALSQFPVVGGRLGEPKKLGGGAIGLTVGIVGSLYGGLGVAQASQYVMNTAWSVPRNQRPNPFKARGRSLLVLATGGVAVIATTVLSAVTASLGNRLGSTVHVFVPIGAIVIMTGVFGFVFRIAAARPLSWSQVAPGAVLSALLWQLLQSFGVLYVSRIVKGSSETNGVFAFVLGLLAFLFLSALSVMFCVELNAVRVNRLYPRSLLTPFTDDVDLTPSDRRSYRDQAQAAQAKGFERVEVTFADRPRSEDGL